MNRIKFLSILVIVQGRVKYVVEKEQQTARVERRVDSYIGTRCSKDEGAIRGHGGSFSYIVKDWKNRQEASNLDATRLKDG